MKKNIRSVVYIGRILINKDDEMKFIYQLTFESDEGISDVYFESLDGIFDFLKNECQFMTEKVVEIRSD
jgi:hypothetical protein